MFDRSRLAHILNHVSPLHRVAFAASCCERLLPNYRAFAQIEQWGAPDLLRQALDVVWSHLEGHPLTESRVLALTREIKEVSPDTEHFRSLFTSPALDAAAAIFYTVRLCRHPEAEQAALVGYKAVTTVQMYLVVLTDPEVIPHVSSTSLDYWIEHSPLMMAELAKQNHDLSELGKQRELTPAFLLSLRRSNIEKGLQPYQRGLILDKSGQL
jgi:uncharacterized protein YjaG (DUF416 family)